MIADLEPVQVKPPDTEGPQEPDALIVTRDAIDDIVGRVDSSLGRDDQERLRQLLMQHAKAFSFTEDDLGHVSITQHHIDVADARPVRQRLRRQPPAHQDAIDDHIASMHRRGIIEPAQSPWAANIVMVRKKDASYRCCIDFRSLNGVTREDTYSLPRIDACLDALSGSAWFTTIDLRDSYYQVALREQDREKTSFICRNGQWQFRRMPMGLCNSGATFQRLVDIILSGLAYETCLAYIDDIIVYSQTTADHFDRLNAVLQRIEDAGLKIKPSKTFALQRSVGFLGHIVSADGVQAHPDKTRQILSWGVPQCIRDVRAYIGITSYYRKYIPRYAEIASPLTAMMQGGGSTFRWTEECQNAFVALKRALTEPPILSLPIDGASYVLDTDASNVAIGAVLSQIQSGEEKVIAYASRHLTRRERNYCTTRKELLAVVFYIRYFRCYLLGNNGPFRLRTDHAAILWLRMIPSLLGSKPAGSRFSRNSIFRWNTTPAGCMAMPTRCPETRVITDGVANRKSHAKATEGRTRRADGWQPFIDNQQRTGTRLRIDGTGTIA